MISVVFGMVGAGCDETEAIGDGADGVGLAGHSGHPTAGRGGVDGPDFTGGPVAGNGDWAGTGGSAGSGDPTGGTGGDVAGVGGIGGMGGVGGMADSGAGADPTKASASSPGPHRVESYTSGWASTTAFTDATIFYPPDAQPPLAGVAVVPGFVSPQESTQPWGPFLASHGMIVITIGVPGFTQPDGRAQALKAALETLQSEHARSASGIAGKLDASRLAVIGWSMGGGGALIASESDPSLKAAISLAGWSPGRQFSSLQVPALLFAAVDDALAGGQSQGFYTSIPSSTSKLLFEVPLGGHWLFNDPANLDGEVGRYGLSWMKVFLEGDERYRTFLEMMPDNPTSDFRIEL